MKKAWLQVLAAISLITSVSVFAVDTAESAVSSVQIIRDARIRTDPDDKGSQTLAFVRAGDVVPLIEQRGLWYKIDYKGIRGWVYSELARPVSGRTAADLFTQEEVSVFSPEVEIEDKTMPLLKYARINKSNAIIRSHIDPNAPDARVLHTVRGRDEYFELVHAGNAWCLVWVSNEKADIDTVGWIQCADITIYNEKPTKSAIVSEAKYVLFGTVAAICAALIIVLIVMVRHVGSERKRNVYIQKNVLIIAKEPKMVQYTLTNATVPIERCFSELGFNVLSVKDSVVARNSIEHSMPDLILIDWNFETAIFAKIENLFSRLTAGNNTHILFFNVPDLSAAPKNKVLQNISFLGLTVSDRDIFNVVTPLLHSEQHSNIQKSIQRCALEGDIDGGNLLEVLQFIEIGSRTGCLTVETNGPFGLIYFRDGRIIYAADVNKGQGVEAVYAILNQPAGKFQFITNKAPKTANLNLPTLSVLMEWTKEKDEARR